MTTLSQIEAKFMDGVFEAARLQRPYVWGGKGDKIWTPQGVIRNPFGVEVFDCSGLITTMLYRAGGPDLRFSHGAAQLEKLCPRPPECDDCSGAFPGLLLRFYPRHVALELCSGTHHTAVLEAAGGGSTTLAPTPGGFVRCNREKRTDFRGEGSLSEAIRALLKL